MNSEKATCSSTKVLRAEKTCNTKVFTNFAISNDSCPPQVETTATVAAVGSFAQTVSAEGVYLQRLDAQPSVSLTAVRQFRDYLEV